MPPRGGLLPSGVFPTHDGSGEKNAEAEAFGLAKARIVQPEGEVFAEDEDRRIASAGRAYFVRRPSPGLIR